MYLYFLFYTTMSECMIFYGPTVPEINYSSSSSSLLNDHGKPMKREVVYKGGWAVLRSC